jgi:hypothetical protein
MLDYAESDAGRETRSVTVEVKIGVQGAPRELALESKLSQEELEKAVQDALSNDKGMLEFTDPRGRKVLVRADALTYLEMGEPEERRVGFGAL